MRGYGRNAFVVFVWVGLIAYSCLFLQSGVLFPFLSGGFLAVLLVWLLTLRKAGKWAGRIHTGITVLALTFVLLEVFTYALLSFGVIRTDIHFFMGGFAGSNRRSVQYDTLAGYRPVAGLRRHMSIGNGELEYDHLTVANAQGWYSKRAYVPQKGKKKRYVVLGDSYSAGISTPLTWVDVVQDRLLAQGNDSVELYNFSMEGAGLVNWHRIFKKEIQPRYEYDALIFAVSSEKDALPDWERDFITGHSYTDATYMAVVDLDRQPVPAGFDKRAALPFFSIYTDGEMDEIKTRYLTGKTSLRYRYMAPDLYFLRTVSRVADLVRALRVWTRNMNACQAKNVAYEALAARPYQESFFWGRYKNHALLYDIWQDCRTAGKQVFWVTIPDHGNALEYVKGNDVIYRNEARYLCGRYGAGWFDGFGIFRGKDEAFVDESYYRYDKHWNAKTVEAFSTQMANYIEHQQ